MAGRHQLQFPLTIIFSPATQGPRRKPKTLSPTANWTAAGELSTWIRTQEEEIVGLPMDSTAAERRIKREGEA